MGHYSFKLPDLGEGIVESEIAEWYIKLGDQVEEDQHIADVMTDKAMVEVTSPVSGKVLSIACEAGATLPVGSELVRFEIEAAATDTPLPAGSGAQPGTGPSEVAVTATPKLAEAAPKQTPSATPAASAPVLTSPSVRRRAREENIDLTRVPGSGPAGRISNQDLDNFIAAGGQLALPPGGLMRAPRHGRTEVKIKGLRKVIAQKMQQSKRNIPHYSYIEEVEVGNLEELRAHLNSERNAEQPKLTLLPFIMQALVRALPKFPHCNANFDDQNNVLTQFDAVHIGIATMTAAGLMVPVVKNVESLDIWQAASELNRVSQAARDNKASAAELSGSTITITSLGAIGGLATTPVINAPETAIIGINKLQERAVVRDGAIVIRKMMNISASFDHRIVDGFDGAQLVQTVKKLLENPATIFMP